MEWVPQLEFINTISQIFNNQVAVIIFNYLLVLGVFLEVGILLWIYFQLNKMELRLERKDISTDNFLKNISEEFKNVKKKRKDQQASTFLEGYFQKEKGKLLTWVKIIEKSPGYYLLAGFLGFFVMMLLAIIDLDLRGISQIEEYTLRIKTLKSALQTGGFTFLTGILTSFILLLITRVWRVSKKIKQLREKIINYLEDEISTDHQEKDLYLEALYQLNETIENSIYKLEEMFEDAFAASLGEMEGQLKEINDSLEDYREMAEDYRRQRITELALYESEAAGSHEREDDEQDNG